MALCILSYNILAGGEDRLPLIAKHLHACEIVIEGDAVAASDHLPSWAEFL